MLHGRKIKLETGVKKERTSKKDNTTIEAANVEEPKEENEAPVVPVKTHTKVIKSVSSDTTVAVSGGDSESVEPSEASIKKSRQILVFGIPTDINKKAFKMAVSKLSRKADVELIKEVYCSVRVLLLIWTDHVTHLTGKRTERIPLHHQSPWKDHDGHSNIARRGC